MKIVEIVWYDAACDHDNLSVGEAGKITPVGRKNVGYLIKKDREKVIISFGTIEDYEKKATVFQDTLVVPRGDVKDIKKLSL